MKINIWIAAKIEHAVMQAMENARPKVKAAIKDPDMCQFIKNWIDDIVDVIWPEIMEEV